MSETSHRYTARIVEREYVTGSLSGNMSEDRTEITGELAAQAQYVCNGRPQIVPASGTCTVTRK